MKHSRRQRARRALAPILLLLTAAPAAAAAQDTIPPQRRDSLEEALARELERLQGDSAQIPLDVQRQPPQAAGQGLNPDISAIGEVLVDLSPDEARYTESGERFALSEVELALQAVVDPYFRADFFIGIHEDVVEVEEAYLTALALPWGLQAKLGRFLLPMGKANLTHVPELHSVRHAAPVREFLGEEGLSAGGVQLSRIFAPLGFYQELQVAVISSLDPAGGHGHGEEEDEHADEELEEPELGLEDQLAGLAHLKSYWDLSEAANVELGFSGALGTMEVERETVVDGLPVHVLERDARALYGADLTVRWRPPGRALYRSFYWSTELLADRRSEETAVGGFSLAQWQVARRWYVGGRLDGVQLREEEHDEHEGEEPGLEEEHADLPWRWSGAGYLTFTPSEFSRFKLALERSWGEAAPEDGRWRAVLQSTFALGPHRPHAF